MEHAYVMNKPREGGKHGRNEERRRLESERVKTEKTEGRETKRQRRASDREPRSWNERVKIQQKRTGKVEKPATSRSVENPEESLTSYGTIRETVPKGRKREIYN
ncbi:hypothetical protein NDU88_006157 [Pleurodeles waltl]|uniref:Uncharacterized protein n=1 Tax=Pleurodeles waltl TaxID=8319 RepID=A0AAV7SNU2_PLEWA|nr:hypothetical protein NDU88_006157 [Pleurodeles waltl]